MIKKDNIRELISGLEKVLELEKNPCSQAWNRATSELESGSGWDAYYWPEVYNTVGAPLCIAFSCKMLNCAMTDIHRNNYDPEEVDNLRATLSQMADFLNKEMEIKKLDFDIYESTCNIDFKGFAHPETDCY